MLFCLTLDPLSKLLKHQDIGYNIGKVRGPDSARKIISRFLFMDDIKLYAESQEHLQKLIQVVHDYSNDIHMEFGLDKCTKCSIEKGKKVETQDFQLNDDSTIADLEEDATYKYLGVEENSNTSSCTQRYTLHISRESRKSASLS